MTKPRIVTHYSAVDNGIIQQIRHLYPYGLDKHLVSFKNAKGQFVLALPLETDTTYYLIKMSRSEATSIFSGYQTEEYQDVVFDFSQDDLAIDELSDEVVDESEDD